MKLTFEPNLKYQRQAIDAVVGLFEGQLPDDADPGFSGVIGNRFDLSDRQILANLRNVQAANELALSKELDGGMHFSVEMETGTGKTYVYLRTIYELNIKYGFKKFVIVVPSIPVREGVLKNLQITHRHFQTLYSNTPARYYVYDRSKVSQIRGFAASDNIEILVINIDSFAKDENIINRPNDKLNGREPIKFIREANPIVIVDEPQNMESEKRAKAIANLNPLCTLRYSATHRNRYNLIYSLDPVKAYDMGLVKQIEVDSVMEENALNGAYIAVESITATKTRVTAKVTIDSNCPDGVKRKTVTVRSGDDLYLLSGQREIYRDGCIVEEIDAAGGFIALSNGQILHTGEQKSDTSDEIMKFQIRRTVEEHLRKELKLHKLGIKVLSLFFIDRVANYRTYAGDGSAVKGKFALWFEEIYNDLMSNPAYRQLDMYPAGKVHNGYFSQDKKGRVKDTSGDTQADDTTYNLIMKDKEMLLDMNTPLRFIFSHTALREGWDNPNVFQICTLNETKSAMKKRQEIGRGLRLAVNKEGMRCYDRNVNRLTVIANESYSDFARALQTEMKEDCGIDFGNRIKPKRDRVPVTFRKGFEADPMFLSIWERIRAKTTYRVEYDTEALISSASAAIKAMPPIAAPAIRSVKNELSLTGTGVTTTYKGEKITALHVSNYPAPDILGYIQSKTELTRSTIFKILDRSGRLGDLQINPQLFMDTAAGIIQHVLQELMIAGIEYVEIGGCAYEMRLFEEQELEIYLDQFTFKVSDKSKTIYEQYVPLDSSVENKFAHDCETSEQVKFYFKLPNWFKIPTPIGFYNPDWAVILENDRRIYFIAETKDTGTPDVDLNKLRPDERLKITCGKACFEKSQTTEYRVVNRVGQLVD